MVPVAVGVGLSWRLTGNVEWLLAVCTLTSATAIQIATNFFNDAIDFTKGTDTGERLGPQRVTQSGLFSPRQVIIAGLIMAVVAVLLSLPMVAARGWPVVAIGLPSLYFAYGYTGGPLPLAYRGLGDLFVVLFFGFVAVIGTVFVQTGNWFAEAVLAGLQVGMLSTVLIAVNNLRDIDGDRVSGKRTLAVRFGQGMARWEITLLCLLPHVAGVVWVLWKQWNGAFLLPLIAVLPGVVVTSGVWRHPPGSVYNKFLGIAAAQLLLFALGFIGACCLG
ncbi:MAG: 1,4-dihydroxy-2-naphthoate octaprenyltransferase [Verrucomicrobiae bacterium]|nr:1,4-dihydroxy-2-naphthoate octaprenyltransferase [Verrucomicrobiae bacterium]